MTKVESFNGQSLTEEIANSISHGLGALLAVAGTWVMLAYALTHSGAITVVSVALYGISLIVLYSVSSLYHATTNYRAKKIFQILDHCSIFLLIFGTYVPVALSMLGGGLGWVIFGVQCACAVIGIALNAIDLKRWHHFSLILYIVMGWAIVFSLKPLLMAIDLTGLILLVSGGLAYTGGVYFYVKNNHRYMHFIWHLFVLLGSVLHYIFVFGYCL